MLYGICHLSIVAMRSEAADASEMISQVLYGELFKILEKRKKWSRIRLAFDRYEGWIDNKQYIEISEEQFLKINKKQVLLAVDLIDFIIMKNDQMIPITIGASVTAPEVCGHRFEGNHVFGKKAKENLIETAFLYLNAPYLWGGKTTFGIDCSGFTQMVYKLNGQSLLRDASQQVTQGEPLSFIEESEPGDLAFFDNAEGSITHVGIIMKDNYIIHASGKVRIDRIDHTGIFNTEENKYTHSLRVIKKLF